MNDRPDASGVLVVDKPSGMTSHDVVAHVRRHFRGKVGHTGTLDPAATGVLPLVLGSATRLASFFQSGDKVYEAGIQLGIETDTYDLQGRIVARHATEGVSEERLEEALSEFRGEQQQQVPAYSAVRVGGERLHRAARRGEEVERPSRQIRIDRLTILSGRRDCWQLEIRCSAGTYVRSLVHDLGATLGCGAIVTSLRRTVAGPFTLDQAVPLEEVATRWCEALVPLEELLNDLPKIDLDDAEASRIRHGNTIVYPSPEGRCRLFSGGWLIAIGESDGHSVQPRIVLRS